MNDIADPPDSTIGSRRVLHADPKKWRWVAGIGAGFVAIGIAMIIREGDFLAWFVTLFFALVAGVGLNQLFGTGSHLELDDDGFTVHNFGRATRERWDECADFKVYRISRVEQVAYDRAADIDTHKGEMNRTISGRTSGLPDTFGMAGDDLAALMGAYRERAVARSWEHHAEAVQAFAATISEELIAAGQPADIITDHAQMALPEDMKPWPSLLAVLKEPRLDGSPHVLICADVLSPLSRWIKTETKRSEALEQLGALELRIIDPDSGNVRRFVRDESA